MPEPTVVTEHITGALTSVVEEPVGVEKEKVPLALSRDVEPISIIRVATIEKVGADPPPVN